MSRRSRPFTGGDARSARSQDDHVAPAAPAPRVLVEDHNGLLVLRLPADDSLHPADITDLARTLGGQDGTAALVVGVAGAAVDALWPRLSEALDSLRETGTRTVRLVMAGAGADSPGRPALARRIAEAWKLAVEAPDGPALVVPGGSVFVPPGNGGWWRFTPGRAPVALGPRLPAPRWQSALHQVPATAVKGCTVDQIPAGLLIRPVDSNRTGQDDLFHAVPVDPARPALVVGVPWGEDVAASDVLQLLEAHPAVAENGLRLIPGGRSDLLPLAQSVARSLGAAVEVTTGLPLIASDGRTGRYSVRSVLLSDDEAPSWLPFVDAVLCVPAPPEQAGGAPPPRVLRWFPPFTGPGGAPVGGSPSANGTVPLSDEWQLVVTRAGLWICSRSGPPVPHSWRPVSAQGPVIEVGRAGDRLTPTLWPVLSRLLAGLTADIRTRTTLHVHAAVPDNGRALRALSAEHGLRVIRFSQPQTPPQAAGRRPAVPTGGLPGHPGMPPAAPGLPPTTPGPPPTTPGMPPSALGMPPTGPGMPPTGPGMPPVGAGLPPTGPGMPPTGAGMPPTGPGMPPTGPGMPPTGQGMPPAGPGVPRSALPEAASPPAAAASPGQALPPAAGEASAAPEPTPPPAPRPQTAAHPPVPQPDGAMQHMPPPAPVSPWHRSTEYEREVFRPLAASAWERHGAVVSQALRGMPELSGPEYESAQLDLMAVRMYLREIGGPLDPRELSAALRAGDQRYLPYAACLASGLGRLPVHRGAVLHGAGGAVFGSALRPGQSLREPAPVSALPLGPVGTPEGPAYAIWSITGRSVGSLKHDGDEIVFAPGTIFRVLDVRTDADSPLVLLRQLPSSGAGLGDGALEDADGTALARLDQALASRSAAVPGPGIWPAHCAGPIGQH
ncbi:hypothetical protein [Peterkaempfera griseoplana]|uniref:hypothetical protein n=1 Tax=Peterkaempfera griseoplana TaxID=66896 RepID=UPI0006E34007|nr:hypothetical protein [Peterkaempfera griseoplana]